MINLFDNLVKEGVLEKSKKSNKDIFALYKALQETTAKCNPAIKDINKIQAGTTIAYSNNDLLDIALKAGYKLNVPPEPKPDPLKNACPINTCSEGIGKPAETFQSSAQRFFTPQFSTEKTPTPAPYYVSAE